MGNDIRIDSLNTAQKRESIENSYNLTRGVEEEPSIWSHLSPTSLAINIAFPFVLGQPGCSKVKMAAGTNWLDKTRMIRLNETASHINSFKIKDPVIDAFKQSELLQLQQKAKSYQTAGKVTKAQLNALNKEYARFAGKHGRKLTKGLGKFATVSPNIGGNLLNTYKLWGKTFLVTEVLFEFGNLWKGFSIPKENGKPGINWETGSKQLLKSTGRIASGWGGQMVGFTIGAKIGAAIGSVIPGAGTFLGGCLGSAIGWAVGGICSQLAKAGYDKLVPSEMEKQKDNYIAELLDDNDRSAKNKELMEQELYMYQQSYAQYAQMLDAANAQQDTETAKEVQEKLATVENAYNIIAEAYQRKFGDKISQALPQDNTTVTTPTNTPVTTPMTQQLTQPVTNTLPQYNNQMAYNMTNPMFNPMMQQNNVFNTLMQTTPSTDWFAMLPLQQQQRMLGLA